MLHKNHGTKRDAGTFNEANPFIFSNPMLLHSTSLRLPNEKRHCGKFFGANATEESSGLGIGSSLDYSKYVAAELRERLNPN